MDDKLLGVNVLCNVFFFIRQELMLRMERMIDDVLKKKRELEYELIFIMIVQVSYMKLIFMSDLLCVIIFIYKGGYGQRYLG